jgi:hypothetical protein
MADTKISALTAASAGAAANEFAINEAGTSKKLTLAQIATYDNPVITGASGAVRNEIGHKTMQVLSADGADVTGTSLVTHMTATGMNVGWWLCEYWIHWQSNVTTTGINMNVDHSGTATPFMAHRIDPIGSTTALATVGIAHQTTEEGVTGNLPSTWAANADAGNLGPNAGVTTANSTQFSRVEALMLVTGNGDLAFRIAAEIAATVVRIKAGSCARYTRLT